MQKVKASSGTPFLEASVPLRGAWTSRRISKSWPARNSVWSGGRTQPSVGQDPRRLNVCADERLAARTRVATREDIVPRFMVKKGKVRKEYEDREPRRKSVVTWVVFMDEMLWFLRSSRWDHCGCYGTIHPAYTRSMISQDFRGEELTFLTTEKGFLLQFITYQDFPYVRDTWCIWEVVEKGRKWITSKNGHTIWRRNKVQDFGSIFVKYLVKE